MKRVIIAVVMVIFLIILATASDLIITKQMKAVYNETKNLIENSESLSDKEIITQSKVIIKKWKKAEKPLHYFDSHDKYEEINKHFGLLELNVKNGNADEITKLIKEISNLIGNYIENRKINLHNVLIVTKSYNNV